MTVPNVAITKLDGNTGVVAPSSKGICAIIAPCASGTAAQPTSVTKAALALATFGNGALTEFAAYMLAITKLPVVLIRAAASTAATYGTIALTGTGTSVPSSGATAPLDDYPNIIITVVNGGTRGSAGITYTYSLDGGNTTSSVQALGTATSITIPNSGVQIALATGTLVTGDVITAAVTGPKLTTSDITTALEALRTSALPWECVLIAGHDAVQATTDALDAWLSAREAEGRFRFFICNARMKNAAETEAAYLTAMTTAWASAASIRGCVGADGGTLVSSVPGRSYVLKRQTSLALAARTMLNAYGRDPAYVADGPVSGFKLPDANGNPLNHDENYYPGLDAIRLVTLRTFDQRQGTFITNANVISTTGSDYVWIQHVRTMNRALEIAFGILTGQLSRGIDKNPKLGPTGQVYGAEKDLLRIEAKVNAAINELRGQVADLRFTLSRTDDLGSNGPANLTGDMQLVALAYVKSFLVNAAFTRSITVAQ